MGNKTFDFSYKKKDFLPQKRPNWAQNWHFWSIWARPCRLLWCPVCGSVGGCGARAVSRKTPIYFIINNDNIDNFSHKVLQLVYVLSINVVLIFALHGDDYL